LKNSANTKHSFWGDFLRGAIVAVALMAGLAQMVLAADPDFGDVKVLAQVPQPGFPEGIVLNGISLMSPARRRSAPRTMVFRHACGFT
jgi:hypothetical protein